MQQLSSSIKHMQAKPYCTVDKNYKPRARIAHTPNFLGSPARGARLLPLEPRPEAVLVEDVPAGELLRRGRHGHVVSADDADRVGGGQLLGRSVGVVHVHVVDGAPEKYRARLIGNWHQIKTFLGRYRNPNLILSHYHRIEMFFKSCVIKIDRLKLF